MKKKLMNDVLQREKRKKGGGDASDQKQVDVSVSGGEGEGATGSTTYPTQQTTPQHKDGTRVMAKVPPPTSKIGTRLLPSKIHQKRLSLLMNMEKKKEEEGEEREETKENGSAPRHPSATPKVKKTTVKESVPSPVAPPVTPKLKKEAVKESAPSPGVSSSVSTTTTPNSINRKKNKKKNKSKINSQLESSGNGVAKGVEEESEDDDWPAMVAFAREKKEEMNAERRRVKVQRKLKRRFSDGEIEREPEPTVPKQDTVPKNGTVTTPSPCPAHPKQLKNGSAAHTKPPASPRPTTVAPPMRDTVSQSTGYGNGVAIRATPKHIRFSSESPVKPTREESDSEMKMNGRMKGGSSPEVSTKHIRFSSESPEKAAVPSPAKSIDNGRSGEEKEESDGGKKMNGRVKRESSPEVSTTSSESSDEEEKKSKKKKMTKRAEVTSSKTKKEEEMTSPVSKMTPSTPEMVKKPAVKSPKEEQVTPFEKEKEKEDKKKRKKDGVNAEKESTVTETETTQEDEEEMEEKEDKKKKKKKRKDRVRAEDDTTVNEPEKEEEEEERIRPSSDLLQMVAAHLANCHGLLVFRLISRETRRIAERQLRNADNVLHLEEFDDENAFTRDDMTQWWEERREAEDTTVGEGKENRSHAQISAYLRMRSVEKKLLRDMDGGLSHPSDAASAVDPSELLQHPLETLDAACLLHESQCAAAARLLQQEGRGLREVWLGHTSEKLARELKKLTSLERFEHRQATMATLERLPMLQMTELRIDIVDESATRAALADHLVNGRNLRALDLNVVPCGPLDGNTASQYTLFTRRIYDRADFTADLEWMIPNVEDGEPDPITLCMPELEHLATNVANVKLFWQLHDSSSLLRSLLSLRVGTLSRTKELITSCELFADTKESRKYRQPGFFSLRDAYETQLESVTLRLADRVGVARLQREVATIFEAIGELPPSLRRLSLSFFYNQFAGVCSPFKKWAESETAADAPDTDHIAIEELHLHFERAFDLRGLPLLLPRAIKKLSIAVNYENEEDARCLGPFLEMLQGLERLEALEDLHIQVWGARCLQPLVAALAACSKMAARLTRIAVGAYPVDEEFFEGAAAASWLRSSLSSFPRIRSFGLHAAVLVRMIPEERRTGYSWRNGLAWLANGVLGGGEEKSRLAFEAVELAAAAALPVLDDGEDYTITPHWEVEYDESALVLKPEDEEEHEEIDDSFSIPHGESDEDNDFITDGEGDEEDHAGDASRDDLERMEEGLEDETERIEKRERRREEKERAAIERGDLKEGDEEEEGEVIDFDAISDGEEEEVQPRSAFVDDEAVESDREESEDEGEQKQEESAESECSSEDDEEYREKEKEEEEGRRNKRKERKQAKVEAEVENRKRKRAFESDEEEEEEMVKTTRNKKKKIIIESDDE